MFGTLDECEEFLTVLVSNKQVEISSESYLGFIKNRFKHFKAICGYNKVSIITTIFSRRINAALQQQSWVNSKSTRG